MPPANNELGRGFLKSEPYLRAQWGDGMERAREKGGRVGGGGVSEPHLGAQCGHCILGVQQQRERARQWRGRREQGVSEIGE